jgi:predicted metalloprotease
MIIDRAFDLISPVMHEWSYEAMAADVLAVQNNVFQYDADTQAGVIGVMLSACRWYRTASIKRQVASCKAVTACQGRRRSGSTS